jgi:YHS domain-containing protein/thioredoxin-related protein
MLHNRILGCSVALAGAVLSLALTARGANKPDAWKHDFLQAMKESQQASKPLLLHFHASWCPPCRQMERDVLHHADVQQLIAPNFIPVLIDSDQHPELIAQFDIRSLPTDVVVASSGTVLMKAEGGRDRKTYLTQLRSVLPESTPHAEPSPMPESPQPRPGEQVARNSAPGTARVNEQPLSAKPATEEKLLIGLDRFSPVALAKHRQWKKGKTELALVYQGVVYLMCDEEEYREFQANPAKYAPRLLGCDPVVLWNTERAIPGSTQFGAYFDDELYLFTSAETRDQFKASPTRFTRPQHTLRIDQIDGPRWR